MAKIIVAALILTRSQLEEEDDLYWPHSGDILAVNTIIDRPKHKCWHKLHTDHLNVLCNGRTTRPSGHFPPWTTALQETSRRSRNPKNPQTAQTLLTSWPCRRRRSASPGRSPPRLWCSSPPASAEPCARAGSSGRACSRRRWPYSTVWHRNTHTQQSGNLHNSNTHYYSFLRQGEQVRSSYRPGIVNLLQVSPPAHRHEHYCNI